ncbi:hypothetical protein [Cellulomonas sp. Marseille-Q8402]
MSSDEHGAAPGSTTLRDHVARAIEATDPTLAERLTHDATAYLELVALSRAARAETDVLLAAAVTSARGAGCTWEQVGAILGMTRQAAQQRYGRAGGHPDPAPETRELRPLTAFNEMAVLARAGRYGWRSVGYGALFHTVVREDRQWEHTRTFGRPPQGEGWQPVGSGWGWWTYWTRPTSEPALPGDPPIAELLHG